MKTTCMLRCSSIVLTAIVLLAAALGTIWYHVGAVDRSIPDERIDTHFGNRGIVVEFAYEGPRYAFEFRHTDIDVHRGIVCFDVSGSAFSDVDMLYLRRLVRFQCLDTLTVRSDSVTNRGIAYINAFHALKHLALESAHVDDGVMPHLASLKQLRSLSLAGCKGITGHNIGCLATLPDLTCLNLTFTALSDSSVPELSRLNGLVELHIGETELSDRAIATLRSNLPETWVQEY